MIQHSPVIEHKHAAIVPSKPVLVHALVTTERLIFSERLSKSSNVLGRGVLHLEVHVRTAASVSMSRLHTQRQVPLLSSRSWSTSRACSRRQARSNFCCE